MKVGVAPRSTHLEGIASGDLERLEHRPFVPNDEALCDSGYEVGSQVSSWQIWSPYNAWGPPTEGNSASCVAKYVGNG